MRGLNDTIAALATPVGNSALAVIRVSGPEVPAFTRALFGKDLEPRLCTHRDLHASDGRLLDDVVAVRYVAGKSYTGEESLELSCHGNPFIAQSILEDLLHRGCRAAEPGEFTRRAFLNNRMDLSQAEAVMDIIHARGERALALAQQQLRGSLGRRMEAIVETLLSAIARVEAYIDFPEEDLPAENREAVQALLGSCEQDLSRLLASNHYGELLRSGIRTVLLGEPNAGKSSLLNRLVGTDRAIVSATPGTTRDFIEETLLVGAHLLRLVDTAGLNTCPDTLEKLGMDKTREKAREADLLLWVIDPQHSPTPELPEEILERMTPDNTIVLLNKCDREAPSPTLPTQVRHCSCLNISALTGQGIDELTQNVERLADAFQIEIGGDLVAINARHTDALGRARQALGKARGQLHNSGPIELIASELREALDACGEISGRVDNERMLDHLFASFCIGK